MDMNNIHILDLLTLATAGQRQTGTLQKSQTLQSSLSSSSSVSLLFMIAM